MNEMNDSLAFREDEHAVYSGKERNKGKKTSRKPCCSEKERNKIFTTEFRKKICLMAIPSNKIKFGSARKAIQKVMVLMW